MISLHLTISNPFKSSFWKTLKSWNWSLSKNKTLEIEIYSRTSLFHIWFEITRHRDHAGFEFTLGLFTYTIAITFYDNRHWDSDGGRWI